MLQSSNSNTNQHNSKCKVNIASHDTKSSTTCVSLLEPHLGLIIPTMNTISPLRIINNFIFVKALQISRLRNKT